MIETMLEPAHEIGVLTGFIGGVIYGYVCMVTVCPKQSVDVPWTFNKRNVLNALGQSEEGILDRSKDHTIDRLPAIVPCTNNSRGFYWTWRIGLIFNKHLYSGL